MPLQLAMVNKNFHTVAREMMLRICRFTTNILIFSDIVAEKPNYEIGSSAKLSFAKKPAVSAWKIDDDDDNDLIDADDLLDEEDKAKPDPSQLRGSNHSNFNIFSEL